MYKLLLLSLVALTGCAIKGTPLPDSRYDDFARSIVGAQRCAEEGHMSIELAAKGWQVMKTNLNSWTYDDYRLRATMDTFYRAEPPPRNICVALAMKISENTQAPKVTWVEPTINMPKYTMCNRIGTQTLCSTY